LLSEVTAEKIKQVCEGVWRDRAAILETRGFTSGEEALVGAAYWRLCNAGRKPGSSIADCAPYLRELIQRYRAEAR
jgi:hypothetical protein